MATSSSPKIEDENQPQVSQSSPQQPPTSPTAQPASQQQIINIYTQPGPATQPPPQAPPPPPQAPPPPQQPPPIAKEPPAQQPPPVPLAGPFGPPFTQKDRRRYMCFEIMKICQIIFCLFFIVVGIVWSLLYFFVDDWDWKHLPHRRRRRDRGFWEHWESIDYWESYLWWNTFASIFGLIGAAGEIKCCQIIYALLEIFNFPYCILPWAIVCGMINDWGRPRDYYGMRHY